MAEVAVDIEGELVNLPGGNGDSNGISLPGAFMRSSDVSVYYMTYAGQRAYELGVPFTKMKEGTHYYVAYEIPYRPTPPDLFLARDGKGEYQQTSHTPKGDKTVHARVSHKQAPLRIKH